MKRKNNLNLFPEIMVVTKLLEEKRGQFKTHGSITWTFSLQKDMTLSFRVNNRSMKPHF